MYHVNLHVYVLMHNHFHLVVETLHANLSEFMRRFNICYTGWFNYHHKTCGHLYQGRYKAILVDVDNYLLELSRYTHLNPVRKTRLSALTEQWQYLTKYKWSSLPGYLSKSRRLDYINYDLIESMIGGANPYKNYLFDGLENGTPNILDQVRYQVILGDDGFISRLQNKHLKGGSVREQPAYRNINTEFVNPVQVIKCVNDHFGISVEKCRYRHGYGIARGIAAEMLYRYCDLNLAAIGELLGGINYTAVGMLRQRLKEKIKNNHSIEDQFKQIDKKIQALVL